MIAPPLNDVECLGQLTTIARDGSTHADVRALAARFADSAALATWIRGLPQRDDSGDPSDGPRVECDVMQRARLGAGDPNCVERAILYLAAAEVIDPQPVRQLATIDISPSLRHTFPLEDGEPVVLDPELPRNALRGGVWAQRNGASSGLQRESELDGPALLAWLMDLAEVEAWERDGELGTERVALARLALDRLAEDGAITVHERADVLYALRLAGLAAVWFGRVGVDGFRAGRALVARLVSRRTRATDGATRNLNPQRTVYWAGKAVATYYGFGGLYDVAYNEVRRRPGAKRKPSERPQRVAVAARRATATQAEVPAAPAATSAPEPPSEAVDETAIASTAEVLGTLNEVNGQKGA